MCGIAGALSLSYNKIPSLQRYLKIMNVLQKHRGPDGEGIWLHPQGFTGFAHRRLSIIDLTTGQQPMSDGLGNWLVYNGEIYNYQELRDELGVSRFKTSSDTEVILHLYRQHGIESLQKLRGMFAFALWDEKNKTLFCSRDRFGIKPFYFTIVDNIFYFASEIKALLPFLGDIETDLEGLKDYLTFQFCLGGKTLFKGVSELLPGHYMTIQNGGIQIRRYWEVYYHIDFDHTEKYFEEELLKRLQDSIRYHLRSDVPVGAYLSGGLDSSLVAALSSSHVDNEFLAFTGKFSLGPEYDESMYARALAQERGFPLYEKDITAGDFIQHIHKVVYHLDYPVAGPGSFAQYMVSMMASQYRKVVLGGQGGDEIFGGYARYLIAYFEQCIKAAIDGTMNSGNFVVTYESIIPNLTALSDYKSLLQEFWREGLFADMDQRYFRLINRAAGLGEEIRWDVLGKYSPFETFRSIFHSNNVGKESYFDLMTHFDFKTLLPALLHVEDRVSMAHGLESRVPLLDHLLVELAASIPADIKFKNGAMKSIFRQIARPFLPKSIIERKDKKGFPIPLTEWLQSDVKEYVCDVFSSQCALKRPLVNNRMVVEGIHKEPRFGRKIWGLLCLELWQQEFHDKASEFVRLKQTMSE